jgi:NAD(P)-dependent dehydrogenase (short-subunit alcohol dehydrogenase family)
MSTALITGASTGIGRTTALRLARSGWTVLAGVRTPEAGAELVAQAGSAQTGTGADGRLRTIELDVTDAAQVAAAAQRVAEIAPDGRLDALINNAGIGVGGPLELVELSEWRQQFEVNLFGQIAMIQALLPALRRAQGRVLLVSSVGGRVVTPFMGPYCASKYAIEAIGDALRVELRSSGVQVALIEPGSIATPIWDKGRSEVQRVQVPPELSEQYGRVPAAMGKALEDTAKRAIPAEQVAATIERALGARHMRSRYLIGRDAKAMVLVRNLLPDRAFDRLIGRVLGV